MVRTINVKGNAVRSLKNFGKDVSGVYRSIFDCIIKFILKYFQQGFVFATLLSKWTKDHWIVLFVTRKCQTNFMEMYCVFQLENCFHSLVKTF